MSSSRLNRPDTLELHELAVDCRLGIHEWEQRSPQTVWVDLELPIDAARAAARDDAGQAVDYAAIIDRIRALASEQAFKLMETLAESIAGVALNQSGAPWVRVGVRKRAIRGLGYAAVRIERRRERRGAITGSTARTRSRSPRAARK
jgi:dihydroneopterin aldolase